MKVTLLIPSRHTVVIRILLHILYIYLSKSGIFSSQSSSVYILLVLLLLLHLTHSYTLSLSLIGIVVISIVLFSRHTSFT